MWSCGWPAPARVTLFLYLGGGDAGPRTVDALCQFLDWADALCFRIRRDGAVRRVDSADATAADTDPAVRAARLLLAETGSGAGADIFISARLPAGAGLGRGASRAATALVALDRLWETHLAPAVLAGLGRRLDARVPLFVDGHAAWLEGARDELTRVEPREPWYLVIVPPAEVDADERYVPAELTPGRAPPTMHDFLAHGGINVFETPVRRRHPAVAEALDWLARQRVTPRLSGTGACVFGAFPDETSARSARKRLPPGWRGVVARGSNRSLLALRSAALDEAR